MSVVPPRFVSPRQLAIALGVSESSLKRWADEGLLHAGRTAGGHRRIAIAEAVRFVRERGIPVLRPEVLGLGQLPGARGDVAGSGEALLQALTADDEAAVRSLLISAFLDGTPVATLCDGPIRAALSTIGELWRHGPRGIVVEHRAVTLCVQVLDTLRTLLPPPSLTAPVALGGAPSGDPYVMPSLAAALVVAEAGFRDVNLGPDLPTEALVDAIDRYRPLLVWRSVSAPSESEVLREDLERAATATPNLVAGGRAIDRRSVAGVAGLVVLDSMDALAAFARGLLSARAPAA